MNQTPCDNSPCWWSLISHHSLLWTLNSEYYNCLTSKDCNTLFKTAGEDYCQKECDSRQRPANAATQEIIDSFVWEVWITLRIGTPNLSPSDYLISQSLRSFLGGVCFDSDEELKSTLLKSTAQNFYDKEITKLVGQYDKCLNNYVDIKLISYTFLWK